MSSGANAQRGDRVRGLNTGRLGTAGIASQFGRILVQWDGENFPSKEERMFIEVIEKGTIHDS